MKRLKFDRIRYIKGLFIFPLCISISDCCYRHNVKKEILLSLLFWHVRFFIFYEREVNNEKSTDSF